MSTGYSIQMLLKMKAAFTEDPTKFWIIGYDDFRQPITFDGRLFRQWFIKCLHEKINRRGQLYQPKKWSDYQYQTAIRRDKQKLQDISKRIRVYQFESKQCKERFAHLLSNYND